MSPSSSQIRGSTDAEEVYRTDGETIIKMAQRDETERDDAERDGETTKGTDTDSEEAEGILDGPRTDYEELLYTMGTLRADVNRLQRRLGEEDVSGEVLAQLGFISGDLDTLSREVVDYIESGADVPDRCPICGDAVEEVDELEPGESYDVDRMCIEETAPDGTGHGLIHFAEG